MTKFNLLQLVPNLESGGVEQGTLDVANFQADSKNKNYIISNGGKMLSYLNKSYVEHYKLPVHSKNIFKMPFTAKKINIFIEKKKINILHVRSRAPAWLLPYLNKNKLKTISTFHNVYGSQNIVKKIYNRQLANVDKIVAISNYVKNEISKTYKIEPEKINIINRGTDTNFFNINENQIDKFYDRKNINLEKKIILYPGRLTEWKGQIEFLEVVENFIHKPVIFYFAGDNKNSSYYNKFIKVLSKKKLNHKCHLLGHLNKDELRMMYRCSDIIISAPIRPEGFGRTISESLSMKKIVLAYNYGGVSDQLDKLNDLYKITPLDSNEMKEKIDLALNLKQDNIMNMGEVARSHIIKNFSKEKMLSLYNELYEDILH